MPRTARSPASNAQLRGAHGAIYPSATMRQSRYSPRTMASVLASWSPPATLPAPSPLLPSAEKKQKGAPPCSGNRARSFLLMRVNRVAALSAQAQRRWPRPPHRIGHSFLLTTRTTCNRRSETKVCDRKCASIRRFIPPPCPEQREQ